MKFRKNIFRKFLTAFTAMLSAFYLTAAPVLAGTVTLTWTAPTTDSSGNSLGELTGYKVYYGTSSGVYSTNVTAGNVTTYQMTLPDGNTYYFAVTAYNSSGESGYSNESSKAMYDTTAPVISSVASSLSSSTSVTVTWTTNESSDSVVYYGVSQTSLTGTAQNTAMTTSHSVTLTNLTASTTYYFKAVSKDAAGNSSSSAVYSISTKDTTAPGNVSSFTATDTGKGSTLSLAWTNPTDSDFAGVKIVSATGATAPSNCTSGTLVYSGTGTSYSATGLTNNTQYSLRICAYDASGNYSSGVTASATPKDTTAPGSVTGFTATAGTNQAVLAWTNPADSDFAGAKVLRKAGSAPSSCSDSAATSVYTGLGNTYTDTGLLTGTVYYYAACSYDTNLNYGTAATASVNLSTDNVAPAQVTDIKSAQPYTRGAYLTWTSPGDDGSLGAAASYDLRISEAIDYPGSMTSSLFSSNWAALTQISGAAAPQSAGAQESLTISSANAGLEMMPNTLYYAAMNATDSSGNTSQTSNVAVIHTALKDGFNAISLPYNAASSATVNTVFGDDVSPVSMQAWVPSGLDASATFSGSWVTVDPAAQVSSLSNGKGYYLYAYALNTSVLDEMDSAGNAQVTANSSGWTRIDLAQGRNLIGNPYLKNVDFTNIKVCKNPAGFSPDTGCSGGTILTFQEAVNSGLLDGDIAYFANSNTFKYEMCNKIECTAKLRPWWGQWIYLLDGSNTYTLAVPKP